MTISFFSVINLHIPIKYHSSVSLYPNLYENSRIKYAFVDMVYFIVYNRTMNKVNIHQAKTHLSEYIAHLKEGESILLCKRNKPVAEIRLLPPLQIKKRPIGLAKKIFHVPESFFESLSEEIIHLFLEHK